MILSQFVKGTFFLKTNVYVGIYDFIVILIKKKEIKTHTIIDISIGWTSFMDSEYWIGRKEETWNDARVSMIIASFN